MMWSNNGQRNSHRKAANIKGYLGGFATVEEAKDDASANMSVPSCDVSSLSGWSALETDHSSNRAHRITTSNSNKSWGMERSAQPSVLVEIPENFPRELDDTVIQSRRHHKSFLGSKDVHSCMSRPIGEENLQGEECVSVTNQWIVEMQRRWLERSKERDDSSAVKEIEKNLFDMDNYFLSIYMNDDASIYTKATTNSSVGSSHSTRQRHPGAYRNRRNVSRQAEQCKGTWIESMKESSTNVFVEGEGCWTPMRGWNIKQKKTWDPQPDDCWNVALGVFDSVPKERLEI